MERITHSEVVDEPVQAVYARWDRFEDLSRFVEGLVAVVRTSQTHLQWRAAAGNIWWETEIVEHIPERRIAWRNTGQPKQSGHIEFEAQGLQRTVVTLDMEFELSDGARKPAPDMKQI
ncbi:MAG: Hsp20 family protein [Betaproteobacteria bacterium]|nr:Hsp20 family protein [Betaproteobacteria bacterium]